MGGLLSKRAKAKWIQRFKIAGLAFAPAFVNATAQLQRGDTFADIKSAAWFWLPIAASVIATLVAGAMQAPADHAETVVSNPGGPL